MAENFKDAPNLDNFAEILPNWTKEEALKIEILEQNADVMNFNVLKCRYSEMYKSMGLGDIGHLLSCNRDGDFCIGFNRDIEFTRTQTIMEGTSHCDFRYKLKSES